MTADSSYQRVQQLLHRLGVTENYTGFPHTVYAVQLSISHGQVLCWGSV